MGGLPWFAPKFSGTKAIFHYTPHEVELPGGVVAWSLHMVSGWSRKMACAEYCTAVSRVPTFNVNQLTLAKKYMCYVLCFTMSTSPTPKHPSALFFSAMVWTGFHVGSLPRCGGCAGTFDQWQRMCLWQWVLADTWPMGRARIDQDGASLTNVLSKEIGMTLGVRFVCFWNDEGHIAARVYPGEW